ncbi:General transcription factor IIE subunit 2 [Porphyridium purpureum]|uniref:General transcription factor IIE subunit 2 n=1 Tax=Porphyridium purpureum TaxID=35688 RepID=A0A5J4YWN9_PORPP|nr:General transcription factor IIE subunit 2 [Porphyridium purpureum]|eukprot:POR8543..scf209_3
MVVEQGGNPVGLLLHRVLKLLQSELRPMSVAEIKSRLPDVDLAVNTELRNNVKSNPKVIVLPDSRYRWKSRYYLRDRADLVALLRRAKAPIVASDLYDSYNGVKADIEELAEANPRQLIKLHIPGSSKTLLFNYEARLYIHIHEEIAKKFHEIRLPEPHDIHLYLKEHDLKKGSHSRPNAGSIMRKRPKKMEARKSRSVKLTNVHMAGTGIDLTQDVELAGGKPSAFKE